MPIPDDLLPGVLGPGVVLAVANCRDLSVRVARPDNPDVVPPPDEGLPTRADDLRVSDAERDLVIGELGERFVEGRLTHETFAARVDAALRAKVKGELSGLVADLPRRRSLGEALWSAMSRSWRRAFSAADQWTRKAPASLMLPVGPQLRFTIGRETACDLMLSDITVSRWHASLEHADSGWLLSDLGSTNGTRVNGWRVTTPTPVSPGDLVTFGAVTFIIRARAGKILPGSSAA